MLRPILAAALLSLPLLAFGCSFINAPDDVIPGETAGGGGGSGAMGGGTSSSSSSASSGTGGAMASCGDGKIDIGETCDPPASCPTACDDGDACTADSLEGDPAACTASCKNAAITTCGAAAADGCCPVSCNGNTDVDCAMCGNGAVDIGEICDGNCPASCDDGIACTTDAMMGSAGTCDAACSNAPIAACVAGDGCCPAGCAPAQDGDCCPNAGGGTSLANNGTGLNELYCYKPGDTTQVRALKACESHFGVGACCVITGGYADMQYGQCNMGGDAGTLHWHWDTHPTNHCAPNYVPGDVVSPGWCGAITGNFLN